MWKMNSGAWSREVGNQTSRWKTCGPWSVLIFLGSIGQYFLIKTKELGEKVNEDSGE